MSFSKGGKSDNSTSSEVTNTSENLNLQDIEGIGIGRAGGDVTIVQTDHNAFGDASALARAALDVGESIHADATRLSLDVTQNALTFGRQTTDTAFSTVERAVGSIEDSNTRALNAVTDVSDNALSSVGDLFSRAFSGITDFVRDLQGNAQKQLGDTTTALNAISVENNKSSDQRIAEISTNAIKYVAFGVAGIALVIGAVIIFKRK